MKEFIDRNNLYVASHGQLSNGPPYIHTDKFTTVDYILTNKAASGFLVGALGESDQPLNVSDHLPLSISLQISPNTLSKHQSQRRIDWRKAITTKAMDNFSNSIEALVMPLLDNTSENIHELDSEIRFVCNTINTLTKDLPVHPPKKHRQTDFKDDLLKLLCKRSKAAWWEWKMPGDHAPVSCGRKRSPQGKKFRRGLII